MSRKAIPSSLFLTAKQKLASTLVSFTACVIVDDNDHREWCMCVIVVVIVIEAVASNRESKKTKEDRCFNGCEKPGKLSSKRGKKRVRVVSIYFFHLFALDADVCAVPLCICLCARIKQTNRRVSSTSLYICMSLDYLHISFHSLAPFFFFFFFETYTCTYRSTRG